MNRRLPGRGVLRRKGVPWRPCSIHPCQTTTRRGMQVALPSRLSNQRPCWKQRSSGKAGQAAWMRRAQMHAAPPQRSKRTADPRLHPGRAVLASPEAQRPAQLLQRCMAHFHPGVAPPGGVAMATQAAVLHQLPRHEGPSTSQVTRRADCHTAGQGVP